MEYYFAPMEGVTGSEFRRVHHKYFPGVDAYYMPFISPTQDHVFTQRELRNILPENNQGFRAVPQLLTKNAEDFLWAARELAAMGYDEINFNLGCPSATVTSKGKGAGLLSNPEFLHQLLGEIYEKTPVKISIKTRLGMEQPEEFERLLDVFQNYPVSLLIIHPRVRQDFYQHPIRMESFEKAVQKYHGAICFNGGLKTVENCVTLEKQYPQIQSIMIGQGLLSNPALIQQMKGLGELEKERLMAFHDTLFQTYLEAFKSERNTVFHMKELWSYLMDLFEGAEKPWKKIRKAADRAGYESGVQDMFALPLKIGKESHN